MIEISNDVVFGFEPALRGMRNPLNSWNKSDSRWYNDPIYDNERPMFIHDNPTFSVGENDHKLAMKLIKAGSDHRKFMRMIQVWVDIKAPLYWWKEFDTYKVGTVANSCSTMHKIADKEFTLNDFSHEHITNEEFLGVKLNHFVSGSIPRQLLCTTIACLNGAREKYLETKDKRYWWQMIQLLPSSYNQLRTVNMNYEVLRNMYHARKNHKLDEWHTFCDWVETLPYSEFITERGE